MGKTIFKDALKFIAEICFLLRLTSWGPTTAQKFLFSRLRSTHKLQLCHGTLMVNICFYSLVTYQAINYNSGQAKDLIHFAAMDYIN